MAFPRSGYRRRERKRGFRGPVPEKLKGSLSKGSPAQVGFNSILVGPTVENPSFNTCCDGDPWESDP